MRRVARRVSTVLVLLAPLIAPSAVSANAAPPQPDLSGFTEVSVDPFVVDGKVYFQAPNGLCAIFLYRSIAGCDSARFPGTSPDVNEIELSSEYTFRALRNATKNTAFVKGGAVPVLRDGQKIAFGDIECAAGPGPRTTCTKGFPVTQWMVISPERTGVGSVSVGVLDGLPDTDDFLLGEESYIGWDPGNTPPVFTVDGGLTCTIRNLQGQGNGDFGCDGYLPGVAGGENEVLVPSLGSPGIRRTDHPQFATPTSAKPVMHLPNGYRVHQVGVSCMAISGGVACYRRSPDSIQGFMVSPAGTRIVDG